MPRRLSRRKSSKRSSARCPPSPPIPLVLFGRVAAGSRPERELRAVERVHGSAGARARVQGKGGGDRAPRPAPAIGDGQLRVAARDPPRPVRPRAAGSPAKDLEAGALRARRLALRVL